jgi:site-specific recombinase XerD
MASLCKFSGKSAEKIARQDVRAFLVDLIAEKASCYSTVNQARCAILYFFTHVRRTPWVVGELPPMKKPRVLPEVLSLQEVARLLDGLEHPRDRILLRAAYACGLRVSELVSMQIRHIQGQRAMLLVQGGKGRKDRYVPLSPRLLDELRDYFRRYLSWNKAGAKTPWLFPRPRNISAHIDPSVPQRAFREAQRRAGLSRGKGIHTLRHCYATHSLELGLDIKTLQERLGHRDIQATLLYLHVANVPHRQLLSPYDFLQADRPPSPESNPQKSEGQDRQE